MPVAGPALIHDFGHALRGIVIGLVAHDPQHVRLPVFELGMAQEVEQDIARRLSGRLLAGILPPGRPDRLGLHGLGRVDVAVHVILRPELAALRRIGPLAVALCVLERPAIHERAVGVDQVFNAEANVHPALDGILPMRLGMPADTRGVVGHGVHHPAVGLAEPQVVLEEVRVPVNVGDDKLLIDKRIALLQVGVAGVVVDDHLINPAKPVMVLLGHPLILHAPLPVRVARREPSVRSDLVHLLVRAHFEDRGKKIEAVGACALADLLLRGV